jgi:hypothetical protein
MQLIWCLHASTNYTSLTHCPQLSSVPCVGPHAAVSSAFGGRCIPCTHAKHNSNQPRMRSPPQMSAMGVGSLPDELLLSSWLLLVLWGSYPRPTMGAAVAPAVANATPHRNSPTHLQTPSRGHVLVGPARTSPGGQF